MARPKQALISKEQVIDVATEILERDGIEALSLRPLAARLNVNSASLYHHFENKNEILLAVVRKALREAAIPPLTENWEDWICENAIQLRRVLAHKPFLISLLLQGIRPHTVAYAISDAKLIEVGIPDTLRPEFLLTLENAVIGSALISIGEKEGKSSQIERFFDHEQLLRNTVRNLLAGMIEQFKARNGSRRATSRKASRGSAAPDNGSA